MSIFQSYPIVPTVSFARLSVAFANTDGSGNSTQLVPICQGVANGGQVSSVKLQATGNTSAALVNFFISQDSGNTKYLVSQFSLPASISDSLTPGFTEAVSDVAAMELTSNVCFLYASVSVAQPANLVVQTTYKGYGNNVV